MPAKKAHIYRGGVLVLTVSAHHRTGLRRAALKPATVEVIAGRGCTVASITPVLGRLEQIGTVERVADGYQLTDRGLVDLMTVPAWAALTLFEDTDRVRESRNTSLEPVRSPAVMAALAGWHLVTRARGWSTITAKGRRVLEAALDVPAKAVG